MAGQNVSFTDLSSNYPTSWQWTFEGGLPAYSTDQNPIVTYNVPGIYSVSLIATNGNGFDSKIQYGYITVTPLQYCTASGSCGVIISGVQLSGINNMDLQCGTNGYADYSDLTADLVCGQRYLLRFTVAMRHNTMLDAEPGSTGTRTWILMIPGVLYDDQYRRFLLFCPDHPAGTNLGRKYTYAHPVVGFRRIAALRGFREWGRSRRLYYSFYPGIKFLKH